MEENMKMRAGGKKAFPHTYILLNQHKKVVYVLCVLVYPDILWMIKELILKLRVGFWGYPLYGAFVRGWGEANESYLVDPASSHMLVSKIKPCMSKYKRFILWNCEWLIKSVIVYLIIPYYLDNRGNSRANTC